ncbi:hypothetical protein FKM82_025424 [Ascaphus truei]|uniref:josephin-2 isoform X1 n=1 Tax=Ascaphus truei TaxID=8439 RepID=UPI003F592D54
MNGSGWSCARCTRSTTCCRATCSASSTRRRSAGAPAPVKHQLSPLSPRLAPDSRFNPHRSVLGTGNYDVNVIMAALQTLDYAAVWWDKRRSLESLVLSEIFGFILNIPSRISLGFLSLPITRKHWIAVQQIHGIYYNLDSKLKAPVKLGGPKELREFLQECISQGSCEVLLVVRKDVEEAKLWISNEERVP